MHNYPYLFLYFFVQIRKNIEKSNKKGICDLTFFIMMFIMPTANALITKKSLFFTLFFFQCFIEKLQRNE